MFVQFATEQWKTFFPPLLPSSNCVFKSGLLPLQIFRVQNLAATFGCTFLSRLKPNASSFHLCATNIHIHPPYSTFISSKWTRIRSNCKIRQRFGPVLYRGGKVNLSANPESGISAGKIQLLVAKDQFVPASEIQHQSKIHARIYW